MRKVMVVVLAMLVGISVLAQSSKDASQDSSDAAYIKKEVRHELVMLPYYTLFDNLEYSVNGSTVTLMGQVTRPVLKTDAENVVNRIKGVNKVINDIEVLPPSPMDDRIRHEEYRAIYGAPQLSKYDWGAVPPIHIIVKNGHVTLTGVVDNQADKDVATIRAKGVPGVFSVTNDLRVVKPGEEK